MHAIHNPRLTLYGAPTLKTAKLPLLLEFPMPAGLQGDGNWWVGMDLVQISRIEKSVQQFGARFIQRVFTPHESGYALSSPALQYERLAARFAAKEACIKALNLSEKGVNWRDMEVLKQTDGSCSLILHGVAQEQATQRGIARIQLSLSHDGDYAAAVVVMARSG